jgi:hypothetical protein
MKYAFYVAVKLVAYIAWCWVGLRLWHVASAKVPKAIGFGVLRLAIGVVFGVAIFLMVSPQPTDLFWKYIAVYAPVRMVEWLIVALLLAPKFEGRTSSTMALWCLGGIVVSFVADFASPEGVAGHFCIGRCLC